MPRFSDKPRRPPPAVGPAPELEVRIGDQEAVRIPVSELARCNDAVEAVADFHCVTGWSVKGLLWRGVHLSALIDQHHGDNRRPAFAIAHGLDGAAAVFRVDDLLDEHTLLATHLNGEPLDPARGAPLRLVAPHLYGYKSIKHLHRIELLNIEPRSTYGAKEHFRARVLHEERRDSMLPNWLVRPVYRLGIVPIAYQAERSARRARPRVSTNSDG